jgi:hypothetical protein
MDRLQQELAALPGMEQLVRLAAACVYANDSHLCVCMCTAVLVPAARPAVENQGAGAHCPLPGGEKAVLAGLYCSPALTYICVLLCI